MARLLTILFASTFMLGFCQADDTSMLYKTPKLGEQFRPDDWVSIPYEKEVFQSWTDEQLWVPAGDVNDPD